MADFLPFYGRRRGRKLSDGSKFLLEKKLPLYLLPNKSHNPAKIFTHSPDKIYLEIGFGGGEHLAIEAKNHPENGYIGAEPFLNGVSSLLRHCENQLIKNLRIWPDDIRFQFSLWPNSCLDGVFIMFPDPWPKIKHAGRRIINKDNLAEIARLLKNGGELRMASDHPCAKNWILASILGNPNFDWPVVSPDDWNIKPQGWPETRYMKKAIAEGRKPAWFHFQKLVI